MSEQDTLRDQFMEEARALSTPGMQWARLYDADRWINRFADCYSTDDALRSLLDLDKDGTNRGNVIFQLKVQVDPAAGAAVREILSKLKILFKPRGFWSYFWAERDAPGNPASPTSSASLSWPWCALKLRALEDVLWTAPCNKSD
eukprot:NODE_7007_length_800_cov_137.567208_g6769_i0.p1 GENE.NODE_7007_length_800_cov_137.567208_g6769_i0~~NODE_7007_length_800_cov_137.567208_g6769_i0.p1  ORF type:complete len:145 (+),score=17.28 NODE_7007_length_800_cov_137.567208_g6769_i0:114-548(+)